MADNIDTLYLVKFWDFTEYTVQFLGGGRGECGAVELEHDMAFIRALECPVMVLHEGSVLASGSLDHVQQNQKVIDVYLGR